jgi:hypothetical protein
MFVRERKTDIQHPESHQTRNEITTIERAEKFVFCFDKLPNHILTVHVTFFLSYQLVLSQAVQSFAPQKTVSV